MKKVMTIFGTRPEMIKMWSVLKALDNSNFKHIMVHTGQNYTPELKDFFFRDLCLREPDYYLNIDVSSYGKEVADVVSKSDEIFEIEKPDALIILGDTYSGLSVLPAKNRGIKIFHMEAGNRCFDQNVPEEINRHIVDHFADFNLAYTNLAKENLLREGLHPRTISVIGSPLNEVISLFKNEIQNSTVLNDLGVLSGEFFLVSAHRQENVDNPKRLIELVEALNSIAKKFELPIIVSTHPRTKNKLDALNIQTNALVAFHTPFGFFDNGDTREPAPLNF